MEERWWLRDNTVGRMWVPAAIAVLAAIASTTADTSPVGDDTLDLLWRAALAAGLTLISARAAPWAWVVLAMGATVIAGWPAALLGLVALALAVAGGFRRLPIDPTGAAVGAIAAQALFRADLPGPLGTETLAALLICVPVIASGSTRLRPGTRATIATSAAVALVVGISSTIAAGLVAFGARDDVTRSVDLSEEALDAARDGDELLAADRLSEARELMAGVDDELSAPWILPARAIPVVGQHVSALLRVSSEGSDAAGAAAALLADVDGDDLAVDAGRVNVGAVRRLQPTTATLVGEVDDLVDTLADVDRPWILGPVSDRLDDARDEIDGIAGSLDAVSTFVDLTPRLLGGDAERRYLVLFATRAESRSGGGFIGNYAEITAADGRITVETTGRSGDLNDALGGQPADLDPDYVETFAAFFPDTVFQNISVSPDFPIVAVQAARFYRAATDLLVDGVIQLDPTAMAAILRVVGPVEVDGRAIGADEVVDFVERDHYLIYDDDEAGRVAALDQLVLGVVSGLATIELPNPWALADAFGPAIDGDHLLVWMRADDEQGALERAGLTGELPDADGRDLLAVTSDNTALNKIDPYLRRTVEYRPVLDPDTGEVEAELTVEIVNEAPPAGLPDAVIGNNDVGYPFGTAIPRLSIYTPLALTGSLLDGEPIVAVATSAHRGWFRHDVHLPLGPGDATTLTVQLAGTIDLADGYELSVLAPALPNADDLTVDVRAPDHWRRVTTRGSEPPVLRNLPLEQDLEVRLSPADGD